MIRWGNKMAMSRIRRKGGKFMEMNVLALTTVGRKSGAERTTPVAWFPGTDGSWLIVASAGGAARDGAWRQITAASPRFAKYQEKTDRQLPVIRLVPRSG